MKPKRVTAKPPPRPVTKIDGANLSEQTSAGTPDDYTALVRLAAAGDTQALEELLLRAQEVAWRFSTAVCGRSDDAEDAMQEALIKTYRYVRTIREPEAFRPWLYRIVRNACLMGRRKKAGEPARLQSLDDVLPDPAGRRRAEVTDPGKNPEQLASNATLRRRLRQALRALPPPYRAIVVLRDVEGLSTREVSQVMGISEDNVKTRLYRARLQLQAALDGVAA